MSDAAFGGAKWEFRPYPAYKDSGVEWLEENPAPLYFDDEGEYTWVRIADVTWQRPSVDPGPFGAGGVLVTGRRLIKT